MSICPSICSKSLVRTVLASALVLAVGGAALGQELQLDPRALDASLATTPAKGKKAGKAQAGKAGGEKAGAQGGKTPDRQFGELEGWSPGKAPPGKKEQEETRGMNSGGGASIGRSPSGNMSVGVPF